MAHLNEQAAALAQVLRELVLHRVVWSWEEISDRALAWLTARETEESSGWRGIAEQAQRGVEFYRGLVITIGEMFGQDARIADDGIDMQEMLCLKVPDLVQSLRAERDRLTTALSGVNEVISQTGHIHGETLKELDQMRAALQRCVPSLIDLATDRDHGWQRIAALEGAARAHVDHVMKLRAAAKEAGATYFPHTLLDDLAALLAPPDAGPAR